MATSDKFGSKNNSSSLDKKKTIGRIGGSSNASSSDKKPTSGASNGVGRTFGSFASKAKFGSKLSTSSSKSSSESSAKSPVTSKPSSGNVKVNLDPKVVQLTLQKISPASAAKVGFFLSIALGIVLIVAALVFWFLLDKSGVLVQLSQGLISSGLGDNVTGGITLFNIILVAVILACLNSLFITLLSAIFAVIYNTAAGLAGGIKLHFIRG